MVMHVRTPEAWGVGSWTWIGYVADSHRPEAKDPPTRREPRSRPRRYRKRNRAGAIHERCC